MEPGCDGPGITAERHAQDAEPAGRQHRPAPGTDHLDRPRGSPGSTAELKENGPGAPHPSDARPSDRSAQPRWPCRGDRGGRRVGAGAGRLGQEDQGISAGLGCKATMETTANCADEAPVSGAATRSRQLAYIGGEHSSAQLTRPTSPQRVLFGNFRYPTPPITAPADPLSRSRSRRKPSDSQVRALARPDQGAEPANGVRASIRSRSNPRAVDRGSASRRRR